MGNNKRSMRQTNKMSTTTTGKNGQIRGNVPPTRSTLSSLKADGTKGYSFRVPKAACWKTTEKSPVSIGGDLGEKAFLTIDSTRCLFRHKQATEAVLLHDFRARAIHICSFTPPGTHRGGVPLFEWGRIERTKGWSAIAAAAAGRYASYTLTTPHDGRYSIRVGIGDRRSNGTRAHTRTHRRMMLVSSSNGGDSVCARFEENETSWDCRTLSGIDPAMMVCVLVGIDKLQTTNQRHHNPSSDNHNRGFLWTKRRIGNERESQREMLVTKSTETSYSSSSHSKSLSFTGISPTGRFQSPWPRPRPHQSNLPAITSFINARAR